MKKTPAYWHWKKKVDLFVFTYSFIVPSFPLSCSYFKQGLNVKPSYKNLHKWRVSARELNQSRDSNSLLHFVQQAMLFALLTDEIGCKCWCGWARKATASPSWASDTHSDNLLSSPWLRVGYWQRLCSCYGACSNCLAVIAKFLPFPPILNLYCTICIRTNVQNF